MISAPVSTRTDLSNHRSHFPGTLILAAAEKSLIKSKEKSKKYLHSLCRKICLVILLERIS